MSTQNNIKNIVVCSDGTGQSGGMLHPSNVWRIYEALDKENQSCIHDDGVGSGGNKIMRTIGGAFGYGISRNLRQIYHFLINEYDPDRENRLFFFGFSRGAFTVRVLAQMVCVFGIPNLRGKDPAEVDRVCNEILRSYKSANKQLSRDAQEKKEQQLDPAENGVLEGMGLPEKPNSQIADDFAKAYCQYPSKKGEVGLEAAGGEVNAWDVSRRVYFLGVWDTVEALGLPVDEFTQAFNWLFPLKFGDNKAHPNVENIYHALSIDEERRTFNPKLFHEQDKVQNGQSITQVWFPGCHAHVGGGYAKDQLAYGALNWMIEHAEFHQLRFNQELKEAYRAQAAYNGLLTDSRGGLRMFYRYGPRHIPRLCHEAGIQPVIHLSAIKRIDRQVAGYSPFALGPSTGTFAAHTDYSVDQFPPAENPFLKEGPEALQELKSELQGAQKLTRARALIFYIMFFTAILTVVWGGVFGKGVEPKWMLELGEFIDSLFSKNVKELVAKFLRGVTDFAPGFVKFVFQGFEKTPGFFLLATLNYVVFFIGDRLSVTMIRDKAAKGWRKYRVDDPSNSGASQKRSGDRWTKLIRYLLHYPAVTFVGFTLLVHIVLASLFWFPMPGWSEHLLKSIYLVATISGVVIVIYSAYMIICWFFKYVVLALSWILDQFMSQRWIEYLVHSWRTHLGPTLAALAVLLGLMYVCGHYWPDFVELFSIENEGNGVD